MKKCLFYLISCVLGLSLGCSKEKAKLILASPEGVYVHSSGIFVSNVGEELDPSKKDGDGFIARLDKHGKVIENHFLPVGDEKLHAPKGMCVVENVLYVADVDCVKGFDLTSRKKVFSVVVPESVFLNDITEKNSKTLLVSATDIGKLIQVDIAGQSFEYLDLPEIKGPNGLEYVAAENKLYVVGWGKDNLPNGEVGVVLMDSLSYLRLGDYQGLLDGLRVDDGKLFFSNWVEFDKKGKLLQMDIQTQEVVDVRIEHFIGGPADFDFMPNGHQIMVPAMMEGEIYLIDR